MQRGPPTVTRRVVSQPKSATLTPIGQSHALTVPSAAASSAARSPSPQDESHQYTSGGGGGGDRSVLLVTVSKSNPAKPLVRDVSRRQRAAAETHGVDTKKPKDDEREQIYNCAKYPEHFNALLKKLPKRNKHVVQMVIERMRTEGVAMDTQTYNLLLEKVVDLRDPIAFSIFEDLKDEAQRDDAAVRPDLTTLHLMVRACERHDDYRRAFQIYTQLKESFGVFPDVPLYNTLIGYCAPLQDEATASFLLEEMRDRGAEPDVHTYNSLMNVFADAPYEVLVQTFEEMIAHKLRPNRRTYTTLMKACQRIGDYDKVFHFFEELKQSGLTADVATYNVLLLSCRDRVDYAVGTGKGSNIRKTKEQREGVLRMIAQLSLSLFAEMEELHVAPNTFTYNALLAVLSRCGDERLFDLFAEMKKAREESVRAGGGGGAGGASFAGGGALVERSSSLVSHQVLLPTEPPLPSFAELERLLEAASQATGSDAGDGIASSGVNPGLETYLTMIEGAARLHQPEKAFAFFDELKKAKIRPDRAVFMKLLDVCAIHADKTRANSYFREAKEEHGISHDADMYNALLNVLAESCDPLVFDQFNDFKYDRARLSIKPNAESYAIMLKAAFKQKNIEQAMLLHEELCDPACPVSPDATTYGWLMDVCSLVPDVARASELMLDMKRRRIKASITTYVKFMNVFVCANDPGVVEVFEELRRHEPAPDLDAYKTLMGYYLTKRDAAIITLFDDMKRSGVEPDLQAFNIMLRYSAAVENQERAFRYFTELQVKNLSPDIETYNAFLAVFAASGSDWIFKTFEDMAETKTAPNSETFAIMMRHKAGRQALNAAADKHLLFALVPPATAGSTGGAK